MTVPGTVTSAAMRAQLAADMTEAVLQAQVVAVARTLGWRVYHTHDSRRSHPGFPDLVLVHTLHGILWRELKTMKGRVTAAQRAWLNDLVEAGENADVWRPVDLLEGRVYRELGARP